MKNAIFMDLVGPEYLPHAKLASIASLIVLLMVYSSLVDLLGKRRLLFVIYATYAALFAFLTWVLSHPHTHRGLGWGFYLAIESFGSLGISHLWSLAVNATRDPEVASRRFPLLAVGGQIGAVSCSGVMVLLAHKTGLVPLLAMAVVLLCLAPMTARRWLIQNHVPDKVETSHDKAGVVEGVRLVMARPYLISILAVVMFYEFVGTFVDYQMNREAKGTFGSVENVARFLALYGLLANSLSLVFAFTGTSFLVRRLGLSRCLVIYPTAMAAVVLTVASVPGLWTFFGAMIALKGLAYGFNKPCLEMLYVPTSDSIQFKAKSWIDTAGSRSGKALGSVMNATFPAAGLLWGGAAVCLTLIAIWRPIGRWAGAKHQELVSQGKELE